MNAPCNYFSVDFFHLTSCIYFYTYIQESIRHALIKSAWKRAKHGVAPLHTHTHIHTQYTQIYSLSRIGSVVWWFWSTIPQRGVWTRWQWQSAAILASSQGSAAAFTPCVCVCVSVEWRVNLWLGSVPGERLQKWPFFIIYCISLFHLISSGSIDPPPTLHCAVSRFGPAPQQGN